jgi:hypothetical protein
MKLAGSHRRNTFFRSLAIFLTTAAIYNHAFSEKALNEPIATIKVAEVVDHYAANQN